MPQRKKKPRVLIVTPEVTYLPTGMGNMANYLSAKAGGLADVSAALVSALFEQGADVHVALPDYRSMFNTRISPVLNREFSIIYDTMPEDRLHLAEDRAFYYLDRVYSGYARENIKVSLSFQREVINNIIPRVRPDLIHANDWMTGLIPGMARRLNIPCLFTIHNIHTVTAYLNEVEDRGIDAAYFWKYLYFKSPPINYEHARDNIPVDFLTSGIFASHFVNTVSPTFLNEIVEGRHGFVEPQIRAELANKHNAGCALGILNAPDPSFYPEEDPVLVRTYGADDHAEGKAANKAYLQKSLGLIEDPNAPVFFWPSRLDPIQKGCQLLADIMYDLISEFWQNNLQIVFTANGDYQMIFKSIVDHHRFYDRVAVCDFNEDLSRLAYGGSDFILMPSSFEPCGLPQMIAPIYGALPVAHDTGGIHDTITHLNTIENSGNGFLFEVFDHGGFMWALREAMRFHLLPAERKYSIIKRIMEESSIRFTHSVTAKNYIDVYEKMLDRPLIDYTE